MKTNFHSRWSATRRQSPRWLGAWQYVRQVRQSGVALVATLIMLSLVTFMVVAFLGVARRERRAIESITSQNEARNAMEAAFARAQGDLLARLLSSGDKWNYWLTVPTNYQNYAYAVNGSFSLTNVNHTNALAQGVNVWLTNLGNLQYDARVPVFSSFYNNSTPFEPTANEAYQGRYYLDFNRNRMFDYTDRQVAGDPHWIGLLEYPNVPHGPTNRFLSRYTFVAVPAGKTVDLNLIHNQAKRLGTTVDGYYRNLGAGAHEMNLAALLAELSPVWGASYTAIDYNTNVLSGSTGIAFTRDALELLRYRYNANYNNLSTLATLFGGPAAGNLVAGGYDVLVNGPLMTNVFLAATTPVDSTALGWAGGSNTSAAAVRYQDINELFLTTRNYTPFTTNLIFAGSNNLTPHNPAAPTVLSVAADRERRTVYNLLSSVGVNSWAATNRLNLNWSNAPYTSGNILIDSAGGEGGGFTDWDPNYFFYNAAELMIRASISSSIYFNTNWIGYGGGDTNLTITNLFFGTNFVGTNYQATISVTNIPIFGAAGNYYLPLVHRLLQFTANLYDATTTNGAAPAYPTVFRPLFAFNTNGWPSNDFIKIYGYTTIGTDATTMLGLPLVDLTDPNSRLAMYTNAPAVTAGGDGTNDTTLVVGIPVIIGARKGFPNFNEFAVQTIFSLTRKLEFLKTNAADPGPLAISGAKPVQTNQNLIISLMTVTGFEVWNSYTNPASLLGAAPLTGRPFPRDLQLVATNITKLVVTNESGPVFTNSFTNSTNFLISSNTWFGGLVNGVNAFKSFLFTNIPQLSLSNYTGAPNPYFRPPLQLPGYALQGIGQSNASFLASGFSTFIRSTNGPAAPSAFPDVRLGIILTNTLNYALYEPGSGRVVDFVLLPSLSTSMDLTAALSATNLSATSDPGLRFFYTNRLGGSVSSNVPQMGVINQFHQSTNIFGVSTNLREWTGFRGSARPFVTQVQTESERFRRFMGLPPTPGIALTFSNSLTTSMQAPYTPTRIIAETTTWEVNDPLVHHMVRDMQDPYGAAGALPRWAKKIEDPFAAPPPPGTLFSPSYPNNAENYPIKPPGLNRAYMPWGYGLQYFGRQGLSPSARTPTAFDQRLKDPGVYNSDQWSFPQRKFANLGWIGRVHRGTPWQTFYLKSDAPNPTNWFFWARSADTNPTNDWRLVDVLSTAISSETTRGLLSVNQTNSAAWAAALGGTMVLSNNGVGAIAMSVTPRTTQLATIVGNATNGIINAKQRIPMWNPVGNYSAGEVAGYWFGSAGTAYYRATAGANQAQNPLTQTTAGNFGYWTNVYYWNNSVTYTVGDVVAHHGVAYYSTIPGNINYPPELNPGLWEPYFSRSFNSMGGILRTPELSVQSPYLNVGAPWQVNTPYFSGNRVYWQGWYYQAITAVPVNNPPVTRGSADFFWRPVGDFLSDVMIERIPQQTLGLLTLEASPKLVLYVYGQSLRPAERGVYVGGGTYQGMVTNYQITGEVAARAVVRIDGLPEPGTLPRPLPTMPPALAAPPTLVVPRVVIEEFKLLNADK